MKETREVREPREPMNSWEITFVMSFMRKNFNSGVTDKNLSKTISSDRKRELRQWAATNYTSYWFREHV